METLNVKRTTPYGFQLEDGSYRNTSEAVRKFSKDKLPATVEVQEVGNKGEITKVKINKGASGKSDIEQMSKLKNKTLSRISALECATKTVLSDDTISPEKRKDVIVTMAEDFVKFIEAENE